MVEKPRYRKGDALTAADVNRTSARARGFTQIQRGTSDGVRSYGGSKKTAHPWTMQGNPQQGSDIPPFSVFGMKRAAAQESVGVVRCHVGMVTGHYDDFSPFALYTNDTVRLKDGYWGTIRPISLGFPIIVRAYEPEPVEGEDPPPDESPEVGKPCGLMRGSYEFSRHRGGFWCIDKFERTVGEELEWFYVVFMTGPQNWYGRTTEAWSSTGPVDVLVRYDDGNEISPNLVDTGDHLKCYCPALPGIGGYSYSSGVSVQVGVDAISGRFIITNVFGCPLATL
jgi:hypothetical protein